ncbi:hypothetical protein NLG97_g4023 [Lecanicillium saksenae]|uniref:Uncharacterized protein n=1 Tax=Lecanicillium saksenae TaxID=468837 RepID=A0ACC1QZ50_9HYPO|nr:hypothetical protein NLG97_g4023 [Lecanicillium saksenae]
MRRTEGMLHLLWFLVALAAARILPNFFFDDAPPTGEEADEYFYDVFDGHEDNYYGRTLMTATDYDSAAYSQQVVFGNNPFQILYSGLYGCTVQRVLDHINGVHVEIPAVPLLLDDDDIKFWSDPKNQPAFPYFYPVGPNVDPSLFPKGETILHLMSPIYQNTALENNVWLYPNRLKEITKRFSDHLGYKPHVAGVPYAPRPPGSSGLRLAQHEPRTKRSLGKFALASKRCYNVADAQRFRQLNLTIRGPQKLRRDIQSWQQSVQSDERLALVRVIKLTGYTISQEREDKESQGRDMPKELHQNAQWIGHPILMGNDGDEEEEPRLLTGMDHKGPLEGEQLLSVQWLDEKLWQPLIGFCKELPGLEDLVFASASPFPRCLLSHLHSDHPECRLHIHKFGLRSLIHSELHTQPIHPDDIALATSPCLYSIVGTTGQYRNYQTVDYNEEAIMEMVNGLAPRLKNVYLLPIIIQASAQPMMTVPRPPFQGFPRSERGGLPESRTRGRLHNLTLYDSEIGIEKLTQWTACTDFEQLRSLALKSSVGLAAVKHLTQMALQNSFPALLSLEVNVSVFYRFGEREADADPLAAELLAALPPLQELHVRGAVRDKSFYAITIHHADTLQKLCFDAGGLDGKPPVTISMAAAGKLAQRCLQIVELELHIARTPGDERETAIYRSIGALPHLRRLTLHLFCNSRPVLSFSAARDLTDPMRASSIQGIYRQAAIDSALARTMFGLLSAGSQLRLLELRPCGLGLSSTLGWWLRWLAREWSVRRDGGNITLRERGVMIRQQALSQIQRQASSSGRSKIHKEVWDATWPPSSEKWWDDWASVPLKMAEKRKFES